MGYLATSQAKPARPAKSPLTTDSLEDTGGTFNWQGGTLNITGAQGVSIGSTPFLASTLILGSNQSLDVTNQLTIESASFFSSAGGNVTASDIEIAERGPWWAARRTLAPAC